MSEDVGVKAPVTRLRRRLSIETEEVKSPAGTITPTKKKGGRLATKPQLDLIEEIDSEQVPKRSTRKTTVKDIEPVEEKVVTPSRRSARIRSNTSILSETPQSLDSPRAKRAARRTSLAGSDNDAPLTPARPTRRTRKDSASSIDKQVDKANKKTSASTEIILEEKEINEDSNTSEKAIDKSPKVRGRKGKKDSLSKSTDIIDDNGEIKIDEELNTSVNKENQEIHKESSEDISKTTSTDIQETDIKKANDNKGDTSGILTEYLDSKQKKSHSILHKSTSAIEDSKSFKSKRHRTKSVSAVATTNSSDYSFFSDTEISVKKRKDKSLKYLPSDNLLNKSEISKKKNDKLSTSLCNVDIDDVVQNTSVTSKKQRETKHDTEMDSTNKSINEESVTINEETTNNSIQKTGWKKNIINQIQTEENIDTKDNNKNVSPIKCFENEPSNDIQPVIFIEDDSNSNPYKNNIHPAHDLDSEDQCVPVVKHDNPINNENQTPHDNSYEPMDIDESIQQNASINTSIKNTSKVVKDMKLKDKSLMSTDPSNDNNVSSNKSKRKSSSSFNSKNEKSIDENKSTLILSQIKDTPCHEPDVISPKANNKDHLSKSINNIPDEMTNKKADKKLSLDYLTSTPLQQKSMKKLGVSIDTSLISTKTENKAKIERENQEFIDNCENSKEQNNIRSDDDSEQSDESEEEVTKTQNEIIDDEAEEASEDYQSGDSQDEDEKEYERENEIVEKGETLDTEEEFSDDTDYEKDSFVVSSDEEDNELLSGSGDDLSTGDDELSMNAKSKKKYNEKKIKEQKKASREMYEARHKLDNSDKKTKKTIIKKNNRQRLESSSSDSDEAATIQLNKYNRLRIDSSQDLSLLKSDDNESIVKKKKRNRLSESISSDTVLNEQEITICNENQLENKDPISVAIKHEPKTPQKDSNLSVVLINENIEEINIDQNTSIMKPNETSDPLQTTMHEASEDTSSSEDNNEIMKNYNSILENLNNNPKNIKSHDISLNINKKLKKCKEPIVDQLNLTQTKSKKNKKSIEKDVRLSSEIEAQRKDEKGKEPIDNNCDDESDSIDMRLLFTEDSNDSESANTEKIKEISTPNISEDKDYIPLKKTEAKTNLLENIDTAIETNDGSSHLNESRKKNKKRRSSQNIREEIIPSLEAEDNECSFFIDTTGTRLDNEETMSKSLNNSAKKNKKRISECDNIVVAIESSNDYDETGENKTPKKSLTAESEVNTEMVTAEDADVSTTSTHSAKKKKKGKKSLNVTEMEDEVQNDIVQDEPASATETTLSGKKKHKSLLSLDESEIIQNIDEGKEQEKSFEIKTSDKKKKKTKKSLSDTQNEPEGDETSDVPVEIIHQSDKKRQSSQSNIDAREIVPLQLDDTDDDEAPLEISYRSDKKDKSGLQSHLSENVVVNETSLNTSKNSAKKRKRKYSATTDENIPLESVKENCNKEQLNESLAGSQRKKRKLNNTTEEPSQQDKDSSKYSKGLDNLDTIEPTKKEKHIAREENISIDKKENTEIVNRNKKRKERDEDDASNVSKILKHDAFSKAQVTRLPSYILNQLDDKPNKAITEAKRAKVIATTTFTVEDTKLRRTKPSNYLEESVYLNDDNFVEKKQKSSIKKPKVLPFIPTASTSYSGFTTNFRINLLPRETQFVAQVTDATNFKKDFLRQQKIKKFHTYDKYKNQRNVKLSKF